MIVYAFGARSVTDRNLVFRKLDPYLGPADHPFDPELWSGGARGADSLAVKWAIDRSVTYYERFADWARWGRSAGCRRNSSLIADLPPQSPCICFAPPWSRRRESLSPGSADAVRKCLVRGLAVTIVFANGAELQLGGTPPFRGRAKTIATQEVLLSCF